MSHLKEEILRLVKASGEIEGSISIVGYCDDDTIAAAYDLKRSGQLRGAFPPNPNQRHGIDWGYVAWPTT